MVGPMIFSLMEPEAAELDAVQVYVIKTSHHKNVDMINELHLTSSRAENVFV